MASMPINGSSAHAFSVRTLAQTDRQTHRQIQDHIAIAYSLAPVKIGGNMKSSSTALAMMCLMFMSSDSASSEEDCSTTS